MGRMLRSSEKYLVENHFLGLELSKRKLYIDEPARKSTESILCGIFGHEKTDADVLDEILERHPSLRNNPEVIFNIDETDVSTSNGERTKALAPKISRA